MIKQTCKNCGKEFWSYPSWIKKGRGKFCSRRCDGIDKTGKPSPIKGKPSTRKGYKHSKETIRKIIESRKWYKPSKKTRKKMSEATKGFKHSEETKRKMRKNHVNFSGSNHPNWKGGKLKSGGCWHIWKPDHPFANKVGYVLHSRLVIEEILERYLTSKEPVHHINKIKDDDRPKNLMVFTSNSAHQRFEQKGQFKSKNKVLPSEIIFDGRKLLHKYS